MDENVGGRPLKVTDPELLKTLADMKIIERLSWEDLAAWYEDHTGDSIHPQTLRNSLVRDGAVLLLNQRASNKVTEAMANVWDKVDIIKLIGYSFNGRFTEWSLLYERALASYLDQEIVMTEADVARMDGLWNGLTGFFLQALSLMREIKGGDVAVPGLEALLNSASVALNALPTVDGESLNPGSMAALIEQVSSSTKAMLEGVNDKHREEARGRFRRIEDEEEDLMEVDA